MPHITPCIIYLDFWIMDDVFPFCFAGITLIGQVVFCCLVPEQ